MASVYPKVSRYGLSDRDSSWSPHAVETMIRKIWGQLHYALLEFLLSARIHGVWRLLTVLTKVWLIVVTGSGNDI